LVFHIFVIFLAIFQLLFQCVCSFPCCWRSL